MEEVPGPSRALGEDEQPSVEMGNDSMPEAVDKPQEPEESIAPTTCEMGTQTEWPLTTKVDASTQCEVSMCDQQCQFPLDVCKAALADHTYFNPNVLHTIRDGQDMDEDDYDSQGSQIDLFPELNESSDNEVENSSQDSADEPMEVVVSQQTESSEFPSSQSEFVPSDDASSSQDEHFISQEQGVEMNHSHCKERVFLVYEEKLRELLRFCPSCGSFIVPESKVEIQNEGSQLSLYLNCLNNCEYKWQSQPPLSDIKGAGNLLFTTGIFFSGITFAKFESFSNLINLKFIGKGTYYNLRERYVFPVVKSKWKEEQAKVFLDLKSRGSGVVLAGDGRCDSPGHCAKYCTYTFLDVESQKVVDFKVVSVSEVANSNQMEKKGFVDTLGHVEANGVKVAVISTDRHPQIKKEMRVNHGDISHAFDPWHLAKSVSKKLSAASKKSGCSDLAPWIPSIVNHLWWCAETCGKDPDVLREKWLSVIHHVTNRHEWPGNRHFHRCEHEQLTPEQQRKKKWLKPGSAAHTALVNIVKDKLLLKDLAHLVEFVHTTSLEVYHALYLKYLPKLTHFTHDVMKLAPCWQPWITISMPIDPRYVFHKITLQQ